MSAAGRIAPQGRPVVVRLDDICLQYGNSVALDHVTLAIEAGEIHALVGPNGAGKTTLIQILCTLLRPDAGALAIAGGDALRDPLAARRHLGVVFQEPTLDLRLTVLENLEFHGLLFGVPATARRRRIDETLDLVDLAEHRQSLVATLSMGTRRRLEIARALIHDPKIIVLDEPTVGLSVEQRHRIHDHLRQLQSERGVTSLFTTHHIDEAEACDRVTILADGRIVAQDTPFRLRQNHGRDLLRMTPRDTACMEAIRSAFPSAQSGTDDSLVVVLGDPAEATEALLRCGSDLAAFSFERSSLESVFGMLTGSGPREATGKGRRAGNSGGRRWGKWL